MTNYITIVSRVNNTLNTKHILKLVRSNIYTNMNKGVKPEKNSIFLKKGKTVISVENREFSRSRMTKRIASLKSSCEI